MIGFLPGTTPASLYDDLKTLASPYATFFSEGRVAPRSEAMDQNIKSIIGDQIKQTGKTSGVIGYSDFDKTQTPGTEFPNADTLLGNMLRGNISPAEFANATTQGRMTYNVNPETGKVTFGSTTYNFRPEVANQGGIFGAFAKGANKRNIDIAPNITIPVDSIRDFGRDFSQFDQARMGRTRQPSSFRSMNNPEVYGELNNKGMMDRLKEGIGSIRDTVTDKLGSVKDFIKSGGVLGSTIKGLGSLFGDYRGGLGYVDEFGVYRSAEELDKQNALGGYYTDAARASRRRDASIQRMLQRRAEGKRIGENRLKELQRQKKIEEAARQASFESMQQGYEDHFSSMGYSSPADRAADTPTGTLGRI